jgi:hypothetical protein
MAEPTVTAATVVVGISAETIAIIGVPSLALLWGLVGAIAMVVFTPAESKSRVVATVLVSGLVGAAGGNWFAEFAGGGKSLMILAAMIAGAGAKTLLSIAITAAASRIQKAGGSQ